MPNNVVGLQLEFYVRARNKSAWSICGALNSPSVHHASPRYWRRHPELHPERVGRKLAAIFM